MLAVWYYYHSKTNPMLGYDADFEGDQILVCL
jgi:hypothetical protein